MVILPKRDALFLKLLSLSKQDLVELSGELKLNPRGKVADVVRRLADIPGIESSLDSFIKRKYAERIEQRRQVISDSDLLRELGKLRLDI